VDVGKKTEYVEYEKSLAVEEELQEGKERLATLKKRSSNVVRQR
jgi:hypothetical protein